MKLFNHKTLMTGWMTVTTVGLAVLAWDRAESGPAKASYQELTVQRLNLVEPDGTPRLIMANSKYYPGIYWKGTEYQHHSRIGDSGILFFNRQGDEVGGMGFDGQRGPDGKPQAGGNITFDQYEQDQTVSLLYSDRGGRRTAGMRVWDRPDQPMGPIIHLSDKAAKAKTDEERAAVRAEMMKVAQSWGPQGERFFAGKQQEDSIVRLSDKQGRPRLVMRVDATGEPTVEFLDEAGKVIKRIDAKG